MFSASPVINPPHGPMAERPNEYAPPVCGSAGDISAIASHMPMYITVMMTVAMNSPPNPPASRPKFQPKKSPEMTAPTPSAQSDQTRAWRFSPRFSKYSASTW